MSKQKVMVASILVIIICVIGLIIYHTRGEKLELQAKRVSSLFTHAPFKQIPYNNEPLKVIKTDYMSKAGCKFTKSVSPKIVLRENRPVEDRHIPMTGEATIKGRVIVESTGKGLGIPLNVGIHNKAGEVRWGKTDADGKYTFDAVPPGKYTVNAGLPFNKKLPNYVSDHFLFTNIEVKAGDKVVNAPDIKIGSSPICDHVGVGRLAQLWKIAAI